MSVVTKPDKNKILARAQENTEYADHEFQQPPVVA